MTDTIMTSQETADYLRIHPLTVRKMFEQGTLPAFKVGRQWRIKKAILDKHLEDQLRPQYNDVLNCQEITLYSGTVVDDPDIFALHLEHNGWMSDMCMAKGGDTQIIPDETLDKLLALPAGTRVEIVAKTRYTPLWSDDA
jgi:excisionase family DNA binding protein